MNTEKQLWILGHKLQMHESSGDFDMGMFETPAGMQGPPPHSHASYKEIFLIVEGEMEFFVNGAKTVKKAGESLDVAPGTLHTFSNTSEAPCKWINIHSPKGFYKFFETFGVPTKEENAASKSLHPEIIQKVLATAADFDMTIPPPPAP